ncbi:hypothetical protein V8F06_013983 [Rhypophila decipiens]
MPHHHLQDKNQDTIAPRWEWFKTFNTLFGYDEQGRYIKHYSPEWSNPAHIAVAREGYRIQSQVLGISDRWGFFDSHPSVHAQQGACATVLFQLSVVVLVFFTVANCFVLSTSDANSRFRACLTLVLMWGFAQLWVTIMAWAHSHVIGMERRAGKLLKNNGGGQYFALSTEG